MRPGIPDVPAATGVSSGDVRRQILLALGGAFAVHYLSRITFGDSSTGADGSNAIKQGAPDFSAANRESNLAAWLVILVMLAIASDIDSTRELAVAFAFLVFLVAFIGNGGDAFRNIQKLRDVYTGKQQDYFKRKDSAKGV
jgi:hypothetical protein